MVIRRVADADVTKESRIDYESDAAGAIRPGNPAIRRFVTPRLVLRPARVLKNSCRPRNERSTARRHGVGKPKGGCLIYLGHCRGLKHMDNIDPGIIGYAKISASRYTRPKHTVTLQSNVHAPRGNKRF